jgi:hypothetical protein
MKFIRKRISLELFCEIIAESLFSNVGQEIKEQSWSSFVDTLFRGDYLP